MKNRRVDGSVPKKEDRTYQFGVDGHLAVIVVRVLHFFVSAELEGAVGDTEHTRYEAFVEATNAFVAIRFD